MELALSTVVTLVILLIVMVVIISFFLGGAEAVFNPIKSISGNATSGITKEAGKLFG